MLPYKGYEVAIWIDLQFHRCHNISYRFGHEFNQALSSIIYEYIKYVVHV